jgi:hypothetical protein
VDTGSGEKQVFSQLSMSVPNIQLALYESTSTGNSDYSMKSDVDYVYVRKYVPQEPTHSFQGTLLPPAASPAPSVQEATGTPNLLTVGLITGIFLIAVILFGILIVMMVRTAKKK